MKCAVLIEHVEITRLLGPTFTVSDEDHCFSFLKDWALVEVATVLCRLSLTFDEMISRSNPTVVVRPTFVVTASEKDTVWVSRSVWEKTCSWTWVWWGSSLHQSRVGVVNHHLPYLLQFPDLPLAALVEHVVHRALG